jgi:outer membrane protein TolC
VPDAPEVEETQEYESSLAANRNFGGEPMEMQLSEAVARGIENNLNLQVQRFEPLIAFEGQEGAWGSFDPTFSIDGGYADGRQQNTNRLTGSGALTGEAPARNRTRGGDADARLDALVPWLGASLGLEFGGSRVNTENFENFSSIKPVYESHAAITARMPLLKGLVWNEPWTRVKTSQTQYAGSRQRFRTDLMNVVQFIETGYWNLVAQKQSVRVAEKSLETARSLLDQTKIEYEVGVKSRVEVVEAEAGVASREFDLIRSVNRYRAAQDDLIDAVLGTQLSPGSRIEIIPADDPEAYVTYQIDMVEAAEKAFQFRPELEAAKYEIERQELELKFAKNQRLPQFDVVGAYGVSGTRGKNISPIAGDDRYEGNFGDTYDDWFSPQGGRDFSVRGVVSIPLGNVGARHSVSRRQLELRRSETSLVRLRQQIILEVRDGARNLESAQEGIEASTRRQIAATEQLRAERVRLEYGESTPFNVLLKEEDLVEAENEKILALFTYRKSVVDLHRAQGTILQMRNIIVDEAASLR